MTPVSRTRVPRDPERYAWEFWWGGRRALAHVEGGRLTLRDADGADVTAEHRWLRPLAESLGSRAVILDGEVAALGATLVYVCYDLLYDDGRSLLDEPFERRRTRLEALAVNGPRWQTAPSWPGEVHAVRRAAAEQGLPGVVGKRLDSAYAPGEESAAWVRLPGKGDGAG
ncbi:hypothetical protein [Microbispora tritici]|uniref:ATP-dependent DNA ligase n=2 Tax=Microbispora TaxID=2005 RepID=UPI0021CC5223|nr:hypothetical protein [Microbispora tritici]